MRVVWAVALAALLLSTSAWAVPVTGNPVAAVWKEQRLNFVYLGRTSRYSCEGLRDKIRGMLLDLGARRDLRVIAVDCDDSTASAQRNSLGPSVTLIFSSPALPDAAAQPLHPGDLKAVDARFERFTIIRDVFHNMDVGDCELVQQFSHQVLPKLATRDIKEDIACVPHQLSGSRFLVRGEILRALPRDLNSPGARAP
ncbi:MAG: hypothetical protein M3N50_08475 [Pseudomonadota bacterium]|nr:hypothetical protein [Pseudomonadota bacterium]